jgi:hypothetical protein
LLLRQHLGYFHTATAISTIVQQHQAYTCRSDAVVGFQWKDWAYPVRDHPLEADKGKQKTPNYQNHQSINAGRQSGKLYQVWSLLPKNPKI